MKTFKANVNSLQEYNVSKEDFEEALLNNENLIQNNKYYGICPYCDSPVRLIGLTREIKVSPYAQHTQNDIPNLAKKTLKSLYCPANTHKRTSDPEERFDNETQDTLHIKNVLIENYDVIAKIINNYSDIYYSRNEKIKIFKKIYESKIWLYPEIDESNIPWIILYLQQPIEIKNKIIKIDSMLYNFLKQQKVPLVKFSNMKNYVLIDKSEKNLDNIFYSFTSHKRYFDKNDDYHESIHAVLTRSKRFDTPPTDGYHKYFDKTIKIQHQELYNKIKYYNDKNLRDKELLNDIKQLILDLK